MARVRGSGLRFRNGLVQYNFSPSVSIMAGAYTKFGLDIRSFRSPLEESVRKVMIPSIQRNFDAEGRPKWEPLTDFTQQIREERGFGGSHPILVQTGRLKRRMNHLSIWDIDRERAEIRELPGDIWYGKLQQAGFNNWWGMQVPARPFVSIQTDDRDDVRKVFQDWLQKRFKATVGRL